MIRRLAPCLFLIVLTAGVLFFPGPSALAQRCEEVVRELNRSLHPQIDEAEMVSILNALNQSANKSLPSKFVARKQAKKMGWKPGRDLWESKKLEGKSVGGDLFSNREGSLPDGKRIWREADLDYRGGHRGPKRIVYSNDGLRAVTVDHYRTFKEVPPCR
jgi:ribonuclease T1